MTQKWCGTGQSASHGFTADAVGGETEVDVRMVQFAYILGIATSWTNWSRSYVCRENIRYSWLGLIRLNESGCPVVSAVFGNSSVSVFRSVVSVMGRLRVRILLIVGSSRWLAWIVRRGIIVVWRRRVVLSLAGWRWSRIIQISCADLRGNRSLLCLQVSVWIIGSTSGWRLVMMIWIGEWLSCRRIIVV